MRVPHNDAVVIDGEHGETVAVERPLPRSSSFSTKPARLNGDQESGILESSHGWNPRAKRKVTAVPR